MKQFLKKLNRCFLMEHLQEGLEIGLKISILWITMEIGQIGMILLICNGWLLELELLRLKHMYQVGTYHQLVNIMEHFTQMTDVHILVWDVIGKQMFLQRLLLLELILQGRFIVNFLTI